VVKNFVIIGVGGYVAPRHLKAISDLGHNLVASMDISDSVGILDRYFPGSYFFTSLADLEAFLIEYKNLGNYIDYFVICSPNYLHRQHIQLGIKYGAEVICEKPLVIDSKDILPLEELAQQYAKNIYTILQLRLHPEIQRIKTLVNQSKIENKHKIELTYITGRGHWYQTSWKGDENKSGGIVCNIGIHLFDMLLWIFGGVVDSETHILTNENASGVLRLERAEVSWFLSIDGNRVSENSNSKIHRSLRIDDFNFDFSSGFEDLHTESYSEIVSHNNGFKIDQVKDSIALVEKIRTDKVLGRQSYGHKFSQF
jgi:UDP-N-acetyl-2-amino-2-deoxyglucuronate dehydrogenase